MNEFMKILLSLTISGTLLLLLILGLKLLYRNKFSRRWQYYIWLIVVLRFLIPFTPGTINIGSLFRMFHTEVITNESYARPNMSVTVNVNDHEMKQALTDEKKDMIAITAAHKSFDLYIYLFLGWAVIGLVLFLRKIIIYQRFVRYIKDGNTEVSDIKTLNLLSDCKEKLNIRTRVELCRNPLIMSPVMIGFFRQSIVLPFRELEDKELSHIFIHELFHYKRRDIFYKWLIQIVICIHWFNPLVYLLEKEINKACELSCDEAVLSVLDDSTRREYGDLLISFVKSNDLCKNSFLSVTLTEGAEQLKERLGAIMNFKKRNKGIQILTGILTLCIIFLAAFVGSYHAEAADALMSTNIDTLPIQSDNLDDKALMESYAAHGIEKDGESIYYQGQLIHVFLDQCPDSSVYTLDINPKGTVSLEIIRDKEGEITGVFYMTEEEVAELLGEQVEIPMINTREWDGSELLAIEAYYETDNVYVLPSTTNKIILKEYLTEDKSDYYASAEIKNDVLSIRSGDRPAANYESYIEIYVPNDLLDHVKVETVSGAIKVDNYAGVITLSTTNGEIYIYSLDMAGRVNKVFGKNQVISL